MKPTLDQEKGEAVQCKGRACTEAQGQEGHRSSAGYHSAGWTGVGRGVWSSVSQGCERWTQRCREETELESHLRGCLGSTPVTSVSLSLSFPHMCNGVFRARGGGGPMCSELEKGSHITEPGGQCLWVCPWQADRGCSWLQGAALAGTRSQSHVAAGLPYLTSWV